MGSERDQLELAGADRSERSMLPLRHPTDTGRTFLAFLTLAAGAHLELDGLALSEVVPTASRLET